MSPKAFVTGATGFVGRRLVRLLCDRGWRVEGLVPPAEKDRPLPDPRMRAVVGDITEPGSLRGTMDGADGVFHLAALVETWLRDPREYFRVNVTGTENVIEEALRSRVPRFIFTSSISGIGTQLGGVTREDSPPGRIFGAYEASKAEAEERVTAGARERGLPAVVLIPGVILGPGDVRNTGRFLLEFARGNLPGIFAEHSFLPVVGVDDVAKAHLLAFERGQVGSRYIVCAENRTWGDLIRLASVASGTPMPSRHIGGRTIWLATRVGELRARLTHKAPVLPAWLGDFMLLGARMDNAKSVAELGMTYTPISASIQAAIDWLRDEGLLAPRPARADVHREIGSNEVPSGAAQENPGTKSPRPPAPKGPGE